MNRKTATATVLAGSAMLTGCAADTTTLDAANHGPAMAETVETLASMDVEETGEAREDLTKWQQICVVGCAVFSNAGCASVSTSCVAGALWSFGGILIPCSYAVVAACTGAATAGAVCSIKCSGG